MKTASRNEDRQSRIIFFGLFLLLFFLIGLMVRPFLSSIIFAGIVAGAFYPLLEFSIERLKWNRALSAMLVCLVILMLVFLPAMYILVRLAREVLDLIRQIQSPQTAVLLKEVLFGEGYIAELAKTIYAFLFPDTAYTPTGLQALLLGGIKKMGGSIISHLNELLGNTLNFIFQFLIMLLVIFSFFLEGPRLKKFLLELSPLPDQDEELLIRKFNEMNFTTLITNAIGGVLQGGLAGIGFAIAGIGSPLMWTTIMIILAFIPLLGISIIFVPVCLYLLVTGHILAAILLFIYCSMIALATENWFKPLFMGNRVQLNSILVFFSIIGGMSAFGMGGIFYGPLIVTIFLTVANLYLEKYAPGR